MRNEALSDGAQIRVAPSAPCELMWGMSLLAATTAPSVSCRERIDLISAPPELVDRLRTTWNDSVIGFEELALLANATGTFFDLEFAALLAELERVRVPDSEIERAFGTEDRDEQRALQNRVRRLVADRPLRRRYAALARETSEAIAPHWDAVGLKEAREQAKALERRAATDSGPDALLPIGHMSRRETYRPFVEVARARGELILTPCYMACDLGHFIDLPGLLSIGIGVDAESSIENLRAEAEGVVARLRALLDPTRVAILCFIGTRSDRSAADVVSAFGLSHPTVSAHLRTLREAGLIDAHKRRTRTVYRGRPEVLVQLLERGLDDILRLSRPPLTREELEPGE